MSIENYKLLELFKQIRKNIEKELISTVFKEEERNKQLGRL